MTEKDTEYDTDRIRELAAKSQAGGLTPEEEAEIHEQWDAMRSELQTILDDVRPFAERIAENPELMLEAGLTDDERDAIEKIAAGEMADE